MLQVSCRYYLLGNATEDISDETSPALPNSSHFATRIGAGANGKTRGC